MIRISIYAMLPMSTEDYRNMALQQADEQFRDWMRGNLMRAATYFNLVVIGEPIFGWRMRSISSAAQRRDQVFWLRVASEEPQWLPGDFWTGNLDANIFANIAKPRVLEVTEWDDQDWRSVRAEVMNLFPGNLCSPTDVLREPLELSSAWWTELARCFHIIRSTSTNRVSITQDKVTHRVKMAFGAQSDLQIKHWETIHGDMHWSNLVEPNFGLLDWEFWGHGPFGTDAATLYCYSLLVPTMARKVYATFGEVLNTPAGRTAQVYAAARLLNRAEQDYPDIISPIRQYIQPLVDECAR